MIRRRSFRARGVGRQRGLAEVGTVLECAMVMGWFAFLILGEKSVSNAADARRSAEDTRMREGSGQPRNSKVPSGVNVPG